MANGSVALPRVIGRRLGSPPMALGGAIVFVVAYGMNHSWKATLGALFTRLAGIEIHAPHFPGVHPFGWLGSVNAEIEGWFSTAQKYGEKGMVWGFVNFATFWVIIGGTLLALGIAVFELGEWTASYVQKALSSHHEARVGPTIAQIQLEIDSIDERLKSWDRARKTGGAAAGAQDWAKINADYKALSGRVKTLEDRTVPRSATRPGVRVKALPRTHPASNHWTEVMTKPVAIALVTDVIATMGLSGLRCPAFTRFLSKSKCGLGRFLESMLGLAVNALVITHLCTVTKLLTRLGVAAQPMIVKLTTGVAELMRCQGASPLPRLPLAEFTLPAVEGDGLPL